MELQEQLRQIKTQLRLYMNGAVSQSMREKGLNYKLNFGVELPRIKEISASFKKDHKLAQALWKEDSRECKILAGLLQPIDTFYQEIADIWIENMPTLEIAEMTCMHLFQHLPYAPSKSLQWISSEDRMAQICGYLTIARLLTRKDEMQQRVANELVDQAICAICSNDTQLRKAALLAIRNFMKHNEENAFFLCRVIEKMKDSTIEGEQILYNMVQAELEN